MEPNQELEIAAPADPIPARSRWLVGAYALLALWGIGYLVLFFAGVIGPN